MTRYDLVGVGAGPSNLSVAALAASIPGLSCRFFERQPELRWHPGLMLPGSALQVSHLKDLVTLVDPTSPYTFLNFLARTGRLHRFAARSAPRVSRKEYEAYLRWTAEALPSVEFGCPVELVEPGPDGFRVVTAESVCTAAALSVGVGPAPSVPAAAAGLTGPGLFHSGEFGLHRDGLRGRDVAVVGGGQSGAEVVEHLLGLPADRAVRSVTWISRRPGFPPLDDSAFTNEWFHPDYVRYFHGLPPARRRQLVEAQTLASDGVSADLLDRIYGLLYDNDFCSDTPVSYALLPGRELSGVSRSGARWRLELRHTDTGAAEEVAADAVVLATGYRFRLPDFLLPLADRIQLTPDGRPALTEDYSAPWTSPHPGRLFFLNAGRLSHGIADPNLSLGAWRAAAVLDAVQGLSGRLGPRSSATTWPPTPARADLPLLAEGAR